MVSNNRLRRSILRKNNEDSSGNDEAGGGKRLSVSFSSFKEVRYVDDNNKVREEVEECQQLTPVSESNASESNKGGGCENDGNSSADDALPWLRTLRTSFDLNDDLSPKQSFLSGGLEMRRAAKCNRSLFPDNLNLTSPPITKEAVQEPAESYTGQFRWRRGSFAEEHSGTTPGFPESRRLSLNASDSDEELLDVIDDSSGSNYCGERFQNPQRKVLKRSLMSLAGGQPEYLKPKFRQSLLNRGSLTEEMKLPSSILDDEHIIPEGDEECSDQEEQPPPNSSASPSSRDITSPLSADTLPPGTSTESTPHINYKGSERNTGSVDHSQEEPSPAASSESASPPISGFAARVVASPGIPERAAAKSRSASRRESTASSGHTLGNSESLFAFGMGTAPPATPEKDTTGSEKVANFPSSSPHRFPSIVRAGMGEVPPQTIEEDSELMEMETETNTHINSGLARRVQDSLQRRRPSHMRVQSLSEVSPSSPNTEHCPLPPQHSSPPTLNIPNVGSTPVGSNDAQQQQRKRISTPDFGDVSGVLQVKKRRTSPEGNAPDHDSPYHDCIESWRSPSGQNVQAATATIPADLVELPEKAFLPSLKSPIVKAKELLSPVLNKKHVQRPAAPEPIPTLDLSLITNLDTSQRVCGPEVLITPQTRFDAGHLTASRTGNMTSLYTVRSLENLESLKALFAFLGLKELIIDIERSMSELKNRAPPGDAASGEATSWKSNLKELMENNGLMLHNITTNVSAVLASQIVEQQASIYSEKLSHLIDNCKLEFIESKLDGILAEGIRLHDGDRDVAMEKFSEALKSQIYLLEFHLEKWWSRNFKKQIIDRTISLTNAHLEDIHGTLCSLSKQLDSRAAELAHIQESLAKVVEDKKLSHELNTELSKSIKILGSQEFQIRRKIELVKAKGAELETELNKILAKQQTKRVEIELRRRKCERMEAILAFLADIKMKRQLTEMVNGVSTLDSNANEINLLVTPHAKIFNMAASTDCRTSASALGNVAEDLNRTRCIMRSVIATFIGKLPLAEFLWHCLPAWILTYDPPNASHVPSLKDIGFRRHRRIDFGDPDKGKDQDNAYFNRYVSFVESVVLHLKDCILWYLSHKAVIEKKSEIPSWSWLCVNNVRPLLLELLELKKLGDGDLSSDLIINCEPSKDSSKTLETKMYSWYTDSDLNWMLRLYVPREMRGRRQLIKVEASINVALAMTSGSLLSSLQWTRFTEFAPSNETAKPVTPIPLPNDSRRDLSLTEYIKWSLSLG